jgi:hypothetical protein
MKVGKGYRSDARRDNPVSAVLTARLLVAPEGL